MTPIHLALIDVLIIAAYFVVVLVLGIWRARAVADSATDYLVAGRRITLPVFVASLVSTWYGGILGVGEFSYKFGVSNWIVFGVPYYLYAGIFAIILAARARRTEYYTIPDQLENVYSRKTSLAGAVFIFLLSNPAPYLLMLATLFTFFFPMPMWLAILVSAVFSLAYIFRGGLVAVVRTDVLQFALMFASFVLIVAVAFSKYGGFDFLRTHVPASHFTWHGGNRPQYVFVWYLIAMSTLVDPNFYQRCFAAKSEKVARTGILISILFWAAFDFLTTSAGLYARAILPALDYPVASYPWLADTILPPVARGFFFVGLFATIMSTLDSFSFVSAVTFGRDFLWKLRRETADDRLNRYTRIGLLVTFVFSAVIAIASGSVIDIWYQLGSIAAPALAVPLGASFTKNWRMSPAAAASGIIAAGCVSLMWLLGGLFTGTTLWGIEPIYPGLLVSGAVFVFDRFQQQRRVSQ